ncbi:secreted protein [Leifsonia xyli subsp. cynodontis DSM 46306]|jgi:hypothetical protein|uniref:Secreted protein n=1 Tax=Leifsonia xyli subsp. cynodontis DSM 46306 TaxID=1389489 RepID=U3P8J6_LEIXC|nr:hypothetical protein [Leifsonia xyli]AGW42146.1 secreted protein [Leifsonia xyli subsp. cynodontis DSM 46306]
MTKKTRRFASVLAAGAASAALVAGAVVAAAPRIGSRVLHSLRRSQLLGGDDHDQLWHPGPLVRAARFAHRFDPLDDLLLAGVRRRRNVDLVLGGSLLPLIHHL